MSGTAEGVPSVGTGVVAIGVAIFKTLDFLLNTEARGVPGSVSASGVGGNGNGAGPTPLARLAILGKPTEVPTTTPCEAASYPWGVTGRPPRCLNNSETMSVVGWLFDPVVDELVGLCAKALLQDRNTMCFSIQENRSSTLEMGGSLASG